MDRKPYSRDRYSGDTMRHTSRPSATFLRRDQPHSTFQNIGSNIKRSTNSHRNDDDFYHRYDRQNTTQEFESFSDSYKGNGQSHYPETSRHRGNTHSESFKNFYEMDETQRPSHQTYDSHIREHSSVPLYQRGHDFCNQQDVSEEIKPSSRYGKETYFQQISNEPRSCFNIGSQSVTNGFLDLPPPPPAWPVDEVKLSGKINPFGENEDNSDSYVEFSRERKFQPKFSGENEDNSDSYVEFIGERKLKPKLGKMARRRINIQAKLLKKVEIDDETRRDSMKVLRNKELQKAALRDIRRTNNAFNISRSFYIMDINVTGGQIPENKHKLFLDAWNDALRNARLNDGYPENLLELSNFSRNVLMMRLLNVNSIPLLETLVEKLPTLWPDAMFRLIPFEQKRATMHFPKGTISKSNAEILHILGKESSMCTKQWVIYFRTPLESNDFFIIGVNDSSFSKKSGNLCFLNQNVPFKLTGNVRSVGTPTNKELEKLIKLDCSGTMTKKLRESLNKALNR